MDHPDMMYVALWKIPWSQKGYIENLFSHSYIFIPLLYDLICLLIVVSRIGKCSANPIVNNYTAVL